MRRNFLNQIAIAGLAMMVGAGCRTTPKTLTPTPVPNEQKAVTEAQPTKPAEPTPGANITPPPPITDSIPAPAPEPKPNGSGIPSTGIWGKDNFNEDRATLQPNTIHFEYDSSVVKKSEMKNLEAVAKYLKTTPADKVGIEGNCDERGTPEYNRALGERRAQSAREYLIKVARISGDRILTKSFGDQRPASPGHDDASRAKNRRDEFVVLKPKN